VHGCATRHKKQFNGHDLIFENEHLFNKINRETISTLSKNKTLKTLISSKRASIIVQLYESLYTEEHINNLNQGKRYHNFLKSFD